MYRGCIRGYIRSYIGIMEKKMDTTIWGLGLFQRFKGQGVGCRAPGVHRTSLGFKYNEWSSSRIRTQ